MKHFINTISFEDENRFYFHSMHQASLSQKEYYLNCCQHTYAIYILLKGSEIVSFKKGTFSMKQGDVFLIDKKAYFETLVHKGEHEFLLINFDMFSLFKNFPLQSEQLAQMFSHDIPFTHLSEMRIDEIMRVILEIKLKTETYPYVKNLRALTKMMHILFEIYDSFIDDNLYINHLEKDSLDLISVILKVKAYIKENYNKPLDLNQLARWAGISPEYLSREFKREVGINISHYIHKTRLQHACYLLVHTNEPITEICFISGFNSISQFNRTFKKHFRCAPSIYRKQQKKASHDAF
ncbi:MAG TPA: AraC family transcriptional regulator [Erysipelothrix sp.]